MSEEGRDRRGRDRDRAANLRDLRAVVRDIVDGEPASEKERNARKAAAADRAASANDRREGIADRAAAKEARDASTRSGE
jgi:hypothetical protein